MISAQEAKALMESSREITKDEFIARHSKFLEKIDNMVRKECVKENADGYFNIIIHDYDEFEHGEFEFFVKFLQELGYKTRSGNGNGDRNKMVEIWWNR
jgi:hypothetical protein